MSLFEFTFGLTAVILGLALTEIASRIARLVLAGPRVRWAAEPLLLSAIIYMVIIVLWLGGWTRREVAETTVGEMALHVGFMLSPYLAAASVLPEPGTEPTVDLYAHYVRVRRFVYGVMIAGLVSTWLAGVVEGRPDAPGLDEPVRLLFQTGVPVVLYTALMFVRWRWLSVVLLAFTLTAFLIGIAARPVAS